jgi:hypothetical protein
MTKARAFAVALLLAVTAYAVAQSFHRYTPADGSDPMPICRKVKKCL